MLREASLLLLIGLCSSVGVGQEAKSAHKSPVGIAGPVIGGDGTPNYLAIWRTRNYLQSSIVYQDNTGVGIGTTSPQAKLDVNGAINTSSAYEIDATPVLSTNPELLNVFVGPLAASSWK